MPTFAEPDLQAKLEYYRDRRLSPAIVDAFYDHAVKHVQSLYPGAAPASARQMVIDRFFRSCREASAEKLETLEALDRHSGDATDDMVERFGIGVFVERADGSDRMRWVAFSRQRDFHGSLKVIKELTTETLQPAVRAHRREAGARLPNNGITSMPLILRERRLRGDAAAETWHALRPHMIGIDEGVRAIELVALVGLSRDRVNRALRWARQVGEVRTVGDYWTRRYVLSMAA